MRQNDPKSQGFLWSRGFGEYFNSVCLYQLLLKATYLWGPFGLPYCVAFVNSSSTIPGSPSDLNTGNGTEGAMVCTSLGSLLRPLFYFLCSNLKAYPVHMILPFTCDCILHFWVIFGILYCEWIMILYSVYWIVYCVDKRKLNEMGSVYEDITLHSVCCDDEE